VRVPARHRILVPARTGSVLVVLAVALTGCSSDEPAASSAPSPRVGSTAGPSAEPGGPTSPGPSASPSTAPSGSGGGPAMSPPPPGSLATVPARPVQRRSPVPLSSPAPVGGGAVVRLVGTRQVTTAGKGAGESSGEDATAFTVEVVNGTSDPLPLDTSVIDVATGPAATPGRPSSGPPAAPLSGTVPAGGTARGTYVFVLPPGGRSAVTLTVSLAGGSPVAVLRGALR